MSAAVADAATAAQEAAVTVNAVANVSNADLMKPLGAPVDLTGAPSPSLVKPDGTPFGSMPLSRMRARYAVRLLGQRRVVSVATRRTPDATPKVGDNVVPFSPPTARAGELNASDSMLLAHCVDGDEEAFRTLMTRHLGAVRATARRIIASPAEADDVAQETFLKLWRGAADVSVSENGLGPWLRRVAVNLAIDWLRKAKRLDVTDEVPEQEVPAGQLDDLEAADRAGRVEEALARLPERQRVAIGLFHFEELSQREVAAAMEISEDALESLLARARRGLRQLLADDIAELL